MDMGEGEVEKKIKGKTEEKGETEEKIEREETNLFRLDPYKDNEEDKYGFNLMSNYMKKQWLNIKDKPLELIDLNYLWWKTSGTRYFQNIFHGGAYDRDLILKDNPLLKNLEILNSYIITVESQDSSWCEKDVKDNKSTFDIIAIPYIEFFIDKKMAILLIFEMNNYSDFVIIRHNNKLYINKSAKKYIENNENIFPLTYRQYKYKEKVAYIKSSTNFHFDDEALQPNSLYDEVDDILDKSFSMAIIISNISGFTPVDDLSTRLLNHLKFLSEI